MNRFLFALCLLTVLSGCTFVSHHRHIQLGEDEPPEMEVTTRVKDLSSATLWHTTKPENRTNGERR